VTQSYSDNVLNIAPNPTTYNITDRKFIVTTKPCNNVDEKNEDNESKQMVQKNLSDFGIVPDKTSKDKQSAEKPTKRKKTFEERLEFHKNQVKKFL